MAKELDWVSFNFSGVEGSDSAATLTACICDSVDDNMKKTVLVNCTLPTPGQAYDAWRTAQIDALKTAEGIE
jgi:hypothetical protein